MKSEIQIRDLLNECEENIKLMEKKEYKELADKLKIERWTYKKILGDKT